jgi:hypothetical protein
MEDAIVTPPATEAAPDTEAEVQSALAGAAVDFDADLKERFTETEYKKLRTVGAFIMRGLDLREACVLSRLNYMKFTELMEKIPEVAEFIDFKQTQYKASLLTVLATGAVGRKEVKTAGYLLENQKQFRNEFGKKSKGDDPDRPMDAIESAIAAVREDGDSHSIVKRLPTATESSLVRTSLPA